MRDSENEDGSHYLGEQRVIWSEFNSKNDTDADEVNKENLQVEVNRIDFDIKIHFIAAQQPENTKQETQVRFENLVQLLPREARNKKCIDDIPVSSSSTFCFVNFLKTSWRPKEKWRSVRTTNLQHWRIFGEACNSISTFRFYTSTANFLKGD